MSAGERRPVVVDASVGIQLFVQEAHSEAVHALFDQLNGEPPLALYVPDLFYIECANILLKYAQRFNRSEAEGLADLADLANLALLATPTASLMQDAYALAAEHGLTAYDACYAVLALRLGAPLVSVDGDLLNLKTADLVTQTPQAFLEELDYGG